MKKEVRPMEVVGVTEHVASPETGPNVVKVLGNVWKAMCPICLFHEVDFLKLVDEHELTQLRLRLYNFPSYREDVNSDYDVLIANDIEDAVDLRKRAMRPETQGHLFCYAIQFRQKYSILSSARKKKNSGSDEAEDITVKKCEGREKTVI